MQKLNLPSGDAYAQALQKFQNTKLSKKLQEKYKVLPYYQKAKTQYITAVGTSFLCNTFSAGTAAVFVYTFMHGLFSGTPFASAAAAIFTCAVLLMIETLKRSTLPGVFKNYFQFTRVQYTHIAFNMVLAAASCIFSFLGAADAVRISTPAPAMHAPEMENIISIRATYQEQIEAIEADAAAYHKTKQWKGRLSDRHAKTYARMLQEKQEIQKQMLQDINQARTTNAQRMDKATTAHAVNTSAHRTNTEIKAYYFCLATLISEIIFVFCVWFMEHYCFRSYSEFAEVDAQPPADQDAYRKTEHTTIEHNGKRLRRADVKSRINTYAKRMQESATDAAKQRNAEMHKFWQQQLHRFNELSKNSETIFV